MADGVQVPLEGSTIFATDEVDLGAGDQHVQYVKLVDGRDGETRRVASWGRFDLATAERFHAIVGSAAPAGASYDDGEVVGVVKVADLGAGFYELERMAVACPGIAGALPALHVVFVALDDGVTPTLPDDGDPLTDLDLNLIGRTTVVDGSTSSEHLAWAVARTYSPGARVIAGHSSDNLYENGVDLYALIVADGAIAVDLSAGAGLFLFGTLRYLGDESL